MDAYNALTPAQMSIVQMIYLGLVIVLCLIALGLWRLSAGQQRAGHRARYVTIRVMSVLVGILGANTLFGVIVTFHWRGLILDTNSAESLGYQIGQAIAGPLVLLATLGLVYTFGRASSWQQKAGHQALFAILSCVTVILAIVSVGMGMVILHL